MLPRIESDLSNCQDFELMEVIQQLVTEIIRNNAQQMRPSSPALTSSTPASTAALRAREKNRRTAFLEDFNFVGITHSASFEQRAQTPEMAKLSSILCSRLAELIIAQQSVSQV